MAASLARPPKQAKLFARFIEFRPLFFNLLSDIEAKKTILC